MNSALITEVLISTDYCQRNLGLILSKVHQTQTRINVTIVAKLQGLSLRDTEPESNAPDWYSCEEGYAVFGITCSNPTPSLDLQESLLHKVP